MAKKWTDLEDGILINLYGTETNRSLADMFGCSYLAIKNRATFLGLTGQKTYRNPGCFRKGQTPWNKGRHFDSGGRSAETRFKPGQKPHTWVPVGSTRVTKDGLLQRKVTDTGCTPRDWKSEHLLVWEKHHRRPVPKGHIVRFRDGDRRNFAPENLVLVSRRENAVINRHLAQGDRFIEGELDILILLARIRMKQTEHERGAA